MAIYDYPVPGSGDPYQYNPEKVTLYPTANVEFSVSPHSRVLKTVRQPGDVWVGRFDYGDHDDEKRAIVGAFWKGLLGKTHRARVWDFAMPNPRGTISGSPLLNASVAQGATSCAIKSAGASTTLMMGDKFNLGTNGQLVEVRDTIVTANGSGLFSVVNFYPPSRKVVAADSAIVYTKPKLVVALREEAQPEWGPAGRHPPFSIEFFEDITA